MAYTIGDVITRARKAIGDPSGVRSDTTTSEGYACQALQLVKNARPDLFIGQFSADLTALVSADAFPLDALAFLPVAMFVGAMIETQDEDSADRARGQLLTSFGVGALK